MSTSSAFEPSSNWSWPDPVVPQASPPGAFPDSPSEPHHRSSFPTSSSTSNEAPPQPSSSSQKKRRTHYPPRQCRICLETVYPETQSFTSALPSSFQPLPRPSYHSSDPELGRLLKPCRCKGSSKYVHEGCLTLWRHADPGFGRRNFWECPTCGYRYRLERLRYGKLLSSWVSQIVLTLLIMFFLTWVLGFVADPILNLYQDPFRTLGSTVISGGKLDSFKKVKTRVYISDQPVSPGVEHLLKGLASMGLLGFFKVLWALGPTGWFNIRTSSGRRGTGQGRVAGISWIVLLVGVGAFMLVSLWIFYYLSFLHAKEENTNAEIDKGRLQGSTTLV
jgi:hypothetical protein